MKKLLLNIATSLAAVIAVCFVTPRAHTAEAALRAPPAAAASATVGVPRAAARARTPNTSRRTSTAPAGGRQMINPQPLPPKVLQPAARSQ
jgi:hypothetical protein